MATYALSPTNARQDRGIQWYLDRVNAERAAAGQAAITATQLVRARADEVFNSWADQEERERQERAETREVRDAYLSASTATQNQVKALLGVS